MTTGYVGADPDQLDALGRQILDGAEHLENTRASLAGGLYEMGWLGDDADLARGDWESQHAPAIAAAVELLRVMSKRLLDNAGQQREASAADAGTVPAFYAAPGGPPASPRGPQELRDYWLNVALNNAGIDMSQWDPSRGADELRPIIEDVYTYYANLYLDNPHLQWAGMAAMIGPSFAAGFYDLAKFRELAQALEGKPGVPAYLQALAHASDAELRYFETTFLRMQQEIFIDQAVMHEAYRNGGLDAVRELYDAGAIDSRMMDAWTQIDEGRRTGDMDLLATGNTALLLREQRDIIDPYYQQMYNHHGPVGQAFTYLMTAVGEPSIPGAQSFADWKPLVVTTDVGVGPDSVFGFDNPVEGDLNIRTPLPDGNLANFDDRWTYITNDTLPAYQELLRTDPQAVTDIVSGDVSGRIDDYRIHNRLDSLLEHYVTDWGVDVDQ
jgi:hypothetical protein